MSNAPATVPSLLAAQALGTMAGQDPANDVKRHTEIFQTTDTDMAACLIAIGIPLRTDPPYATMKMANGDLRVRYNFQPRSVNGLLESAKMAKLYLQGTAFVEANEEHPLAVAMSAIINRRKLIDWIKSHRPYVAFRLGKGKLQYVVEGSPLHSQHVKAGHKQV